MNITVNVNPVIEILRCAEINCDNIKRGGSVFADIVRAQIQDALMRLGAEPVTKKVFDAGAG